MHRQHPGCRGRVLQPCVEAASSRSALRSAVGGGLAPAETEHLLPESEPSELKVDSDEDMHRLVANLRQCVRCSWAAADMRFVPAAGIMASWWVGSS